MKRGNDHARIKGEDQKPIKLGNWTIFKLYLIPHLQWGLTNDHGLLHFGAISKI